MIVGVVTATAEHALAVGANARPADRDELWASDRYTPTRAILSGMAMAAECWCALFDGEPACVFGVTPATILGGVARPWLIGTPLLEQHPMAFLRRSRHVVRRWSRAYNTLENYVDARNCHAVAWLSWLGFDVQPPQPYGPDKLPFHRFTMGA